MARSIPLTSTLREYYAWPSLCVLLCLQHQAKDILILNNIRVFLRMCPSVIQFKVLFFVHVCHWVPLAAISIRNTNVKDMPGTRADVGNMQTISHTLRYSASNRLHILSLHYTCRDSRSQTSKLKPLKVMPLSYRHKWLHAKAFIYRERGGDSRRRSHILHRW